MVLNLVETLPKKNSYNVFFDNFFTTFRLVQHLGDNNIRATGTVHRSQLHKTPITGPNELQKKARGFHEELSASDNSITLAGWNDTRHVYVSSNTHPVHPVSSVRRWDKKNKAFIQVPRPNIIEAYNKGTGGVDRCDQNVATYRIAIRGKKWWWALFAWLPDMIMQNAWNLYRQYQTVSDTHYDLLTFRQEIVNTYIMQHRDRERRRMVPRGRVLPADRRISTDIRYDGFNIYQNVSREIDVAQYARRVLSEVARSATLVSMITALESGIDWNDSERGQK